MIDDDGRHLHMFVIYENPADLPHDGYVVRRWVVCAHDGGGPPQADPMAVVAITLDSARATVPDGLFCLERMSNDDPTIREVWL